MISGAPPAPISDKSTLSRSPRVVEGGNQSAPSRAARDGTAYQGNGGAGYTKYGRYQPPSKPYREPRQGYDRNRSYGQQQHANDGASYVANYEFYASGASGYYSTVPYDAETSSMQQGKGRQPPHQQSVQEPAGAQDQQQFNYTVPYGMYGYPAPSYPPQQQQPHSQYQKQHHAHSARSMSSAPTGGTLLPGRRSGVTKFFSSVKGFGFIVPHVALEDGAEHEVFVHHTAITAPMRTFRSLGEGEQVEFDVMRGAKGYYAQNVTGPGGVLVRGDPKITTLPMMPRKPYGMRAGAGPMSANGMMGMPGQHFYAENQGEHGPMPNMDGPAPAADGAEFDPSAQQFSHQQQQQQMMMPYYCYVPMPAAAPAAASEMSASAAGNGAMGGAPNAAPTSGPNDPRAAGAYMYAAPGAYGYPPGPYQMMAPSQMHQPPPPHASGSQQFQQSGIPDSASNTPQPPPPGFMYYGAGGAPTMVPHQVAQSHQVAPQQQQQVGGMAGTTPAPYPYNMMMMNPYMGMPQPMPIHQHSPVDANALDAKLAAINVAEANNSGAGKEGPSSPDSAIDPTSDTVSQSKE